MKKILSFFVCVCVLLLNGCGAQERTTEVTANKHYFEAIILEVNDGDLLVEPMDGTTERASSDQITVCTADVAEEDSLQ